MYTVGDIYPYLGMNTASVTVPKKDEAESTEVNKQITTNASSNPQLWTLLALVALLVLLKFLDE